MEADVIASMGGQILQVSGFSRKECGFSDSNMQICCDIIHIFLLRQCPTSPIWMASITHLHWGMYIQEISLCKKISADLVDLKMHCLGFKQEGTTCLRTAQAILMYSCLVSVKHTNLVMWTASNVVVELVQVNREKKEE